MKFKNIYTISFFLCLCTIFASAQEEISSFSHYQITSVWYVSPSDTTDISEDFAHDHFFAFFIEDVDGNEMFTIRSYETNEIMCFGEIALMEREEVDDYLALIYSTNVYCDPEQEAPVSTIVLENIPGSKDETGFQFYYIWMIVNLEEAMVFQCFDVTAED